MNNRVKQPGNSIASNKHIAILFACVAVVLLLIIVTWLNLAWRPDMTGLTPDSGFYAYIGKAILHGQIPYRDVWDDKPPLGYYLNALALAIFGQTPFGVWWSGIFWISGCTLLFFFVIKKPFGSITAGVTSSLFLLALMSPKVFDGGNMMEVYGLLPQIAIIGVTYQYFTHQKNPWLPLVVGVLTAAAYLIKQPTIVLGSASILLILASLVSEKKISQAFKAGVSFVSGFVGIMLIVASYWLIVGAFDTFLDGAILQGFSFIGGSESNLIGNFFHALVTSFPKLFISWLYTIALITAIIFLIEILYRFWIRPVLKARLRWFEWCLVAAMILFPIVADQLWRSTHTKITTVIAIIGVGLFILVKYWRLKDKPQNQSVFSPLEWTWLVGVVALPFEALMTSLGGRYYGHYVITMIPAVCLVVAYPLWRVLFITKDTLLKKTALLSNVLYSALGILIIAWGAISLALVIPGAKYLDNITNIFTRPLTTNDLENYIIQTTQPQDEVLVWHIHVGINFITDRKAPSRFLFPLNLFIPPSEKNNRLKEYVDDLEANPPELIVFQKYSSISLPFVDQPVDQLCQTYCTPEFEKAIKLPQIRQQWIRFQDFVQAHYAPDTNIYDWTIYRRIP